MNKKNIFLAVVLAIVLLMIVFSFSRVKIKMELNSSVFSNGEKIPKKYTCEGDEVSPPLSISGVPEDAKSLAIVVHDPDVPKALQEQFGAPAEWPHWEIFNIPPKTEEIAEGESPDGAVQGKNGGGKIGYQGPCPPKEHSPSKHRYFFRLYALDTELDLQEGASREEVEKAMEGHIIAKAELMGVYEKES